MFHVEQVKGRITMFHVEHSYLFIVIIYSKEKDKCFTWNILHKKLVNIALQCFCEINTSPII